MKWPFRTRGRRVNGHPESRACLLTPLALQLNALPRGPNFLFFLRFQTSAEFTSCRRLFVGKSESSLSGCSYLNSVTNGNQWAFSGFCKVSIVSRSCFFFPLFTFGTKITSDSAALSHIHPLIFLNLIFECKKNRNRCQPKLTNIQSVKLFHCPKAIPYGILRKKNSCTCNCK